MPVTIRPLDMQLMRDTFHYADGQIYWIKNGRKVGCLMKSGYVRAQLQRRKYYVHRIVWALHYGDFETGYELDHINGDRSDNRIENLRLVTHGGNMFNIKSKAKSGMRFVHKYKYGYQVKYRRNGKCHYLGSFKDFNDAKDVAAELIKELSKTHEAPDVQGALAL